jgi:hypothetical protein
MASAKIEALKFEISQDISKHIIDPTEIKDEIEKAVIKAVSSDVLKKVGEYNQHVEYYFKHDKVKLEIVASQARRACKDFVEFLDELRASSAIMLTGGNDNSSEGTEVFGNDN